MRSNGLSLERKQQWMRERHGCASELVPGPGDRAAAFERHFTPHELAQLWSLDETTIRRIFSEEPGVLKIGDPSRRDGKRVYLTLRIPESVAQRVHDERAR